MDRFLEIPNAIWVVFQWRSQMCSRIPISSKFIFRVSFSGSWNSATISKNGTCFVVGPGLQCTDVGSVGPHRCGTAPLLQQSSLPFNCGFLRLGAAGPLPHRTHGRERGRGPRVQKSDLNVACSQKQSHATLGVVYYLFHGIIVWLDTLLNHCTVFANVGFPSEGNYFVKILIVGGQ